MFSDQYHYKIKLFRPISLICPICLISPIRPIRIICFLKNIQENKKCNYYLFIIHYYLLFISTYFYCISIVFLM